MRVIGQDLRGRHLAVHEDLGGLCDSKPPLIIVWRVTERCDLGCRFCEYSRHLSRSRRSTAAATVLAFGAVLRDYSTLTGRSVHISFLGGEPLLWRPLFDVAHALKHDYKLQTGVTTNGTRLHLLAVREQLCGAFDQVTVSVDGLEPWHTECRNAPGLWPRLRAGVRALADLKAQRGARPLLRVNTVLMRSNLLDLEALCRELAAWGVEVVTFNALGGQTGDAFYEQERLRPEHIAWLRSALPGLRAQMVDLGLAISGSDFYLARLDQQAQAMPWPVADCHPGALYLFVDELGRIGPCDATTSGYGVPVNELRSADVFAQLPRRLAELRRQQQLPACADCRSTAVFGKFVEVAA